MVSTQDKRVRNIVRFSEKIGELTVEVGRCCAVGRNGFHRCPGWLHTHFRSFQAAASVQDEKRILFQFDRAAFSFKFLPFKVPYPVPFRLLGDEAKGWLDITYLSPSGAIRIARGNKVRVFPWVLCVYSYARRIWDMQTNVVFAHQDRERRLPK